MREARRSPRHPLAEGFPEAFCPVCHAKLLDGWWIGLLICRKCGEPVLRTVLPAAALDRAGVAGASTARRGP